MGGVTAISYARYEAPDLEVMEKFLVAFGLVRCLRTPTALYMRGTGARQYIHVTELAEQPRAVGLGFQVAELADLEAIAAQVDASVEHSTEPGGGARVVLRDPNGMRVDIHHGQQDASELPVRAPLVLNNSRSAPRSGVLQRPAKGPSHVARMEHAVFTGPNFDQALRFYQDVLGMRISDRIHSGDGSENLVVFLHCGLGQQFTDHHSLALMRSPTVGMDHAAFVTLDWDDLMLGHEHLKQTDYRHEWGVGRHILGSEVFDYWRDPFGNKVEHCTDGDMVNEDHEPGVAAITDDILAIWSPPMADTFGEISERSRSC